MSRLNQIASGDDAGNQAADAGREKAGQAASTAGGAMAAKAGKAVVAAVGWKAVLIGAGAIALAILLVIVLVFASFTANSPGNPDTGSAGAAGSTLDPTHVPDEYVDLIVAAGNECEGINSPFIAAMLESESNFNARAVSPVGAEGPAQFMPGTWAMYGQGGDPFNPADAIPAQARFLCDLYDQATKAVDSGKASGAVLDLVMAGYNAGFGAVTRYGGVPPFTETRNYVKKINKLIEKYTAKEPAGDGGGGSGGRTHPAPGYPQTSPFGYRIHPITGKRRLHAGIDFGVPCGDPIIAWDDGKVVFSGWQGGYGNRVEIDHGGGLISTYSHAIKTTVNKGDQVKGGDQVTVNGTTGSSTGCHLHFEIKKNGTYVDPKDYLP